MNRKADFYYETGTAMEAIHYTAGGSTIDWMYGEHHIVSFVLEAVPPCEIRWCQGHQVYQHSEPNAATMKHFVELASDYRIYEKTLSMPAVSFVLLAALSGIVVYSVAKRRHNCRLFLFRLFGLAVMFKGKDGEVTQDEKVEMTSLTI